jgi:hypothetical protein
MPQGYAVTADAAVERYRTEHPDMPENVFFIVRVIVSPPRSGDDQPHTTHGAA